MSLVNHSALKNEYGSRQIIDSHAHVLEEYFKEDQHEVITRSLNAGVSQLINPGVDIASIPELIALADRYPHIYVGLGVHPHEAKSWDSQAQEAICQVIEHKKVVAVGECGLDFYYNNSPKEQQVAALKAQMQIAQKYDKPLIIHCRNAWDVLFELFTEHGKGIRAVLHCFTGDEQILKKFAMFDFYVSFSGILTFPNAKAIRASVPLVKMERLLVETDCPFLAPQKVRGQRNEPAYVWMVADKLAEIRQVPLEEIAANCSKNARDLFRLP